MVCGWVSLPSGCRRSLAHWTCQLEFWHKLCIFVQAGGQAGGAPPSASPSGTDDNGKGADGNSSSPSDAKHFRTLGWSHRFLCNAPGWFSRYYYCNVAVSSNSNSSSWYLYLSPASMFCLFIIPMASSHVIPRSRSHVMIPSRPEPLS